MERNIKSLSKLRHRQLFSRQNFSFHKPGRKLKWIIIKISEGGGPVGRNSDDQEIGETGRQIKGTEAPLA